MTVLLSGNKTTYTLAVPATVGDVGKHRADSVRPGRPLKLDGPASSYCSGDICVDCILVADYIGISARGISYASRPRRDDLKAKCYLLVLIRRNKAEI